MGDRIDISNNSGVVSDVGNRQTINYFQPAESGGQPAGSGGQPAEARDGRPELALYSFADIVGYSQLNVRLQRLSQDDLVAALDHGLAEAGIAPELVTGQDQGDARLLAFPAGTDAARVLAIMPRCVNDDLVARNKDMAAHARMRIRLAFAMGTSTKGAAGLVGAAPISVVRIANSEVFRNAMRAAPRSECGVIVDEFLYAEWVRQGFRTDMNSGDYAPVRVSNPEKGFEATAWMRLFGYSGQQLRSLLG